MTPASMTDTTTDGTPASRCIAVAPASSAPNRMPLPMIDEGIESRQERNRDGRVSVPRRDVLVQRVCHARHLDCSSQTSNRSAQEKRAHRHTLDVDQSRRSRSTRVGTHRAKTKSARGKPHRPPRSHTGDNCDRKPQMKARSVREPRKVGCVGDRRRLRVDMRRLLHRTAHEVGHQIAPRRSSA